MTEDSETQDQASDDQEQITALVEQSTEVKQVSEPVAAEEVSWKDIKPEPQFFPPAIETVADVKPATPMVQVQRAVTATAAEVSIQHLDTRIMKQTSDELQGYLDAMLPAKRITEKDGGQWQHFLHGVIVRALSETDPQVFKQKWTAILRFFHDNKVALCNPNYIYRFMSKWPGSNTELVVFRLLVWILMETCDPVSRRAKFQGMTTKSLTGLSEHQRNNLNSYYA